MMKNNADINKIIIFLPNWIGDAVLSLPAIYRIREIFPSARISVIGLPHVTELFYESPYVDDKMSYPLKKNKSDILPAASEIRKGRYDLAVLFPNSLRSALIARLAGIPLRCGYIRDGRGLLLNFPVKLSKEIRKVHQSEYYLNIASAFDFNPDTLPTPKLYLSKQEEQNAEEFLKKNDITPEDLLIGINPGAAYGSSKRWYPERYGSVARTLIRKYKSKIIIFGSLKETDIGNEIASLAEAPVLNAAGKTSVRELMALIHRCKCIITNDSGPMHIAAALGIPVTAIFGSTDPVKSGPSGEGHVVIKKDVPCSPCFLRTCPTDLKCMDLISVEDVLEGVAKIDRSKK
ncbi:MAG: lipopolysaccharide heptosyltransferase II [Nitrospirae bacterium]|nr:lipopolysaccharide heptosyltransferase II [Nitrospirota bacterium]